MFYFATAGSMLMTASQNSGRWLSRTMVIALVLFLLGSARIPCLWAIAGLLQRIVFSIAIVWIVETATRAQRGSDPTRFA